MLSIRGFETLFKKQHNFTFKQNSMESQFIKQAKRKRLWLMCRALFSWPSSQFLRKQVENHSSKESRRSGFLVAEHLLCSLHMWSLSPLLRPSVPLEIRC